MEKMMWVRPALDLVQFESDDYVSACNAVFTAELHCGLPNDPTKIDGYNYKNCADDNQHGFGSHPGSWENCGAFHDTREWNTSWHGVCANDGTHDFQGNKNEHMLTGTGAYDTDVWGLEIGQEYTGQSVNYADPNCIGTLASSILKGFSYLATWFSGEYGTGNKRQHWGIATILESNGGNPNKS